MRESAIAYIYIRLQITKHSDVNASKNIVRDDGDEDILRVSETLRE